jgi:hypothetical protein
MAEYYWHISETKERAYLCPYPPGTMAPPDNPEQMAWGEWVGYVNSNGIVAMRHGPWPSWREVARLKLRTQSERLDAAKLILLSLKQTGSKESS